ncbi:MAG TPA: hypothetical protein VL002_02380, partial [Candidimonas sp.]|nr:hypothetical protein [Candidimonas sp.]
MLSALVSSSFTRLFNWSAPKEGSGRPFTKNSGVPLMLSAFTSFALKGINKKTSETLGVGVTAATYELGKLAAYSHLNFSTRLHI